MNKRKTLFISTSCSLMCGRRSDTPPGLGQTGRCDPRESLRGIAGKDMWRSGSDLITNMGLLFFLGCRK